MSKQQIEQEPQDTVNPVWDIFRYVVILALVGFGIWYYYFKKPVVLTAQQTQGRTMGTDYSVKVHDFPEKKDWHVVAESIQARLDAIDQAMSTFKSDSDICRFNASDSTEWFDVSADTARVVRKAQEIASLTGGALDITVAPLVDLWGFGPKDGLTGMAELLERSAQIKERVGFGRLEVRSDPPGLKKELPELTIDLSAIAKGFAVDAVGELLEEHQLRNYMVEVGGEVRCRGNKGNRGDWTIGIEKPLPVPPGMMPGLQCKLHLHDESLATSGDYQNFREVDGVRFSHLIDPRTGLPAERIAPGEPTPKERLGSVSVIEKDCVRADALATALFVLGPEKGLELARQNHLAVLYLIRTEDKNAPIREAASPLFLEKVEPSEK